MTRASRDDPASRPGSLAAPVAVIAQQRSGRHSSGQKPQGFPVASLEGCGADLAVVHATPQIEGTHQDESGLSPRGKGPE